MIFVNKYQAELAPCPLKIIVICHILTSASLLAPPLGSQISYGTPRKGVTDLIAASAESVA